MVHGEPLTPSAIPIRTLQHNTTRPGHAALTPVLNTMRVTGTGSNTHLWNAMPVSSTCKHRKGPMGHSQQIA